MPMAGTYIPASHRLDITSDSKHKKATERRPEGDGPIQGPSVPRWMDEPLPLERTDFLVSGGSALPPPCQLRYLLVVVVVVVAVLIACLNVYRHGFAYFKLCRTH